MSHLDDASDLPRSLNLFDTTTTVVGAIIGTGIFLKAAAIAQLLPDPNMVLLLWVAAGVLSLFGALVITELGGMFPHSGGLYIYLMEAFGPFVAFLFGWSMLAILQTGSITAIAAGVMQAAAALPHCHMNDHQQFVGAIILIVVITIINCISVRATASVQNFLTVLKSLGLVVLIIGALLPGKSSLANWTPGIQTIPHAFAAAFGLAMIKALWVYDGWIDVSFVAGEVQNPQRNLRRAMFLGMGFVIAAYIVLNACYHLVLPVAAVQHAESVANDTAVAIAGVTGGTIVSILVVLSSTGGLNTSLLTGGRVYFAMARENLFFPVVGAIHPRFQTPYVSLILQSAWSIGLLFLWSRFEAISDNVIFCYWFFYALGALAVIVLRVKRPTLDRPYRCPGFPVIPILFIVAAVCLIANTLIENPWNSLSGLGLMVSGAVLYPFFRSYRQSA